jgi:hypothetical protein
MILEFNSSLIQKTFFHWALVEKCTFQFMQRGFVVGCDFLERNQTAV